MSLLSLVDEAIKLCKVEETKINENILQYREILRSLRPQQEDGKEIELTDDVEKDPDVQLEERREMKLLNRLLEKALRVRAGTAPQKDPQNCPGPKKEPVDTTQGKGRALTPGGTKGNKNGIKTTSKPITMDKKESKKYSASHLSWGGRGRMGHPVGHSGQGRASMIRSSVQMQKRSVVSSKGFPPQSSGKEVKQAGPPGPVSHDQGQSPQASSAHHQVEVSHRSAAATSFQPPKWDTVSVSHMEGMPKAHVISPPQNRAPTPLTKWISLRTKQSRLWDKVLALQSKPVAERSHFTERVKATFSREWPTSGSPADTGAQVDRLTQLCTDLSHCYQSERLLTGQTFRTSGTEPATCQKSEYESLLMLEGLEKMVADLRKHAGQLRKEWEAWDRWRRLKGEGAGAFCPVRSKGEWGDLSGVTPLPPTLTYTSQAELQEVERLRLRVGLLQQEVHLHQALSDTMVMPSAPGLPNPAVLRDIYSLLGEGGVMFPTLVLDTEPD
ncbi:tubulin epsilon and delta complex protein 2 isoform X2 [Oncorhynchus kisutch]|uniref:tubulin epsilon and delta complex protein 2 isoform X2 n=1 Tax=Oncorhynchus kisutch TaxID=8019 RepID=UPI0012DBE517|nr:tubulin epsilon and delta complex protein 2-like isoform X2 [Oncorhynchus kisutch]XP_031669564.1 tubulin epsilon and delta complex protein 2-like isoform X2 [Oncorhynchus kisutch]XP_031669565.1 tubulin epsilon and delta complex protein 2-like isoform X2 [Oncorhynchus kisutch]